MLLVNTGFKVERNFLSTFCPRNESPPIGQTILVYFCYSFALVAVTQIIMGECFDAIILHEV